MTHRSNAILAVFMLLAHQSFAAPQLFNNRFSGFGGFGNNGGSVRFGSPPQQQQRFAQTPSQANGIGSGFGGGLFTGGSNQQQQGLPSATFPGQGNSGGGNGFGNGQQQQQFGNTAGVVGNNPGDRFLQQFGQQQQPAVGNNGQFGAINNNPVGSFPQPQASNQFGQSQQQATSGQLPAGNNGGFNGNKNAGSNNFQPSNGVGVASSSGGKINMNDGVTGNSGFDDDAKLLDTFHNSFMPNQPQQQQPQQVVPENSADGGGDAQFDPNEQQQQIQQQQQQQQQQFSPAGFRQQQLQARLQGGFAPQPQAQGGSQLDGRLLFSNNVANRRPGDVSTVLATQSQQQQSPQGGAGGLSGDDLAALQKAGIDPTQVSLGDAPPQPNRFRRPPPTLTSGVGGIAINDPNDQSPTIIPAMGRRPPPMRRRPRPPPPPQPMDEGSSDSGADDGTSGGGGGEDSAPPPSARPPQGGKQLDPAQFGLPPGTIILGEQTFDSGESEVDAKGKSASDHFVPPPLKKGAIKTGRIEGDDPDAMKKLIAQLKALTSQGGGGGGDAAPTDDQKGTARDVADDAPATPSAVPTVQDSLQQALAKQPASSPTSRPTVTL